MNTIFKLIWNKSLGQMVVVSENAKSVGKTDNTTGAVVSPEVLVTDSGIHRIFGLQTLVLSIATIMGAHAWAEVCDVNGSGETGGSTATGSNAFACGNNTASSGIGSTAVGNGKNVHSVENYYYAGYAYAGYAESTLTFDNFVIGTNRPSDSSAVWVYDGSLTAEMITSINGQTNLTDAAKQAFVNYVVGSGWAAKYNQASGIASSALGVVNTASGLASSAVGFNNTASGDASAAYGTSNQATAQYSSAFGTYSSATADKATAIGYDSLADEANTISVGRTGAEKRITNVADPIKVTDAANKNYVDTGLATKVSQTDLASGLTLKADKAAFDSLNAQITDSTTGLSSKASQTSLNSLDGRVTSSEGKIVTLETGLNTVNTNIGNLQTGLTTANNTITTLGNRVTTNEADIASLQQGQGTLNQLAVQYDNSTKESINLTGTNGTKLTNLQAGDISSANSKDAVTGGQLYSTNQNINSLSNQLSTSANQFASILGGGAGFNNNGVFVLPSFTIQGASYSNIGATFGAVNNELTALKSSVSNLKNYVDQQDTKTLSDANAYTDKQGSGTLANAKSYIDQQDAKNLNDAKSYTDQQTAQSLTDSKNYTDQQTTTVLNDAKNYTDQQAVLTLNTAKSYTDQKVADAGQYISIGGNGAAATTGSNATGQNSTAIGPNTVVTGNNSTAVGVDNTVSGHGSGAFGDPNSVSGNGSYVIGNNNMVKGDNTFVLGNNADTEAKNAVVLGNNSTNDRDNTVSVGSVTNQRQITNVAAGAADTDAVNVAQMNKSSSDTLASANHYTETRFAGLENTFKDYSLQTERRFQEVDKRFDRQGAMSAAMMNMATSTSGLRGQNRIGVGAGVQGQEQAVAVGYQRMIDENTSLSISGALSREESSGGVGVGFSW